MRQWLTNLFLKVTSFIYKRKRGLLVSHGFKNFINVLIVIFLEAILTLLSLPLFLMVSGTKGEEGGQVEYKIRRILTFGIIIFIVIFWVLKIGFIVAGSYYFDPRSIYKVAEVVSDGAEVEFVATDIVGSEYTTSLEKPIIDSISLDFNNRVIISGSVSEVIIGENIEGTAKGKATIFNDTSNNQVLVKDTRLLTPDKKLFRIEDRVFVPAYGEVEVNIYSDKEGIEGLIEPTGFIVPGLREELQEYIYAKTSEPTAILTETGEIKASPKPENLVVSLYLLSKEEVMDGVSRLYSVGVDKDGKWEIIQNQGIFYPTAGTYTASAVVYDLDKKQKSDFSQSVEFELEEVFWEKLAKKVDKILNYSVLGFVIIGTILAACCI